MPMSNERQFYVPMQVQESKPTEPGTSRMMCIDIFRGLAIAGMIVVDNPGSDDKAYGALQHASWNGWSPADLIFPSFLFLVGVSLVFSFGARRRRGESRKQVLLHAFKRSLLLIAIGLLVNASPIVGLDLHTWRLLGVTNASRSVTSPRQSLSFGQIG